MGSAVYIRSTRSTGRQQERRAVHGAPVTVQQLDEEDHVGKSEACHR